MFSAGFSWWLNGKESTYQCRRCGFNPWVGKIPWRRKWQATPVFLAGKFQRQRNLVGFSPWVCKRVHTTEQLSSKSLRAIKYTVFAPITTIHLHIVSSSRAETVPIKHQFFIPSLPSAPGNHHDAFCLCGFDSGNLCKWNLSIFVSLPLAYLT